MNNEIDNCCGTTADKQKMAQEIADLKQQVDKLAQANSGLNSRLTNSVALHNEIVVKSNGLKSMIDVAREVLNALEEDGFYGPYALGEDLYNKFKCSLDKAPRQCLASVKADAEKKGYWQGFETGSMNPCDNILTHYNLWLELKASNEKYANKLREGKS